ncbi:hypothetical protein SM360_04805, partial [Liquorilactobacillus nagelii]
MATEKSDSDSSSSADSVKDVSSSTNQKNSTSASTAKTIISETSSSQQVTDDKNSTSSSTADQQSNAIQQSDKNVTSNAVNKSTIGTEKTTSSQNDNVKKVMAMALKNDSSKQITNNYQQKKIGNYWYLVDDSGKYLVGFQKIANQHKTVYYANN